MKFDIRKNIPARELLKLAWKMSDNEREFFIWLKGYMEDLLEKSKRVDPPSNN